MDARTLHKAIAVVCPVHSAAVDVEDDRSTWSFIPKPEATSAEVVAGENVIATIPDVVPPPVDPTAILSDHEQRLRAVEVATGLREAEG